MRRSFRSEEWSVALTRAVKPVCRAVLKDATRRDFFPPEGSRVLPGWLGRGTVRGACTHHQWRPDLTHSSAWRGSRSRRRHRKRIDGDRRGHRDRRDTGRSHPTHRAHRLPNDRRRLALDAHRDPSADRLTVMPVGLPRSRRGRAALAMLTAPSEAPIFRLRSAANRSGSSIVPVRSSVCIRPSELAPWWMGCGLCQMPPQHRVLRFALLLRR